jgi:hypothetical protein
VNTSAVATEPAASPVLGALSVAVSSLLSLAVLAALVLLAREARTNQLQPAASER